MTYKPLPDCLTIKESSTHGLGLYATEDIPQGTDLGITHVKQYSGEPLRTPLGGFYNHSEDPNCVKEEAGLYLRLVTLRSIKAGEELLVNYTFYKIG